MDETHAQITKIAREVNKFVVRTLKKDGIGSSEFDLIHAVRKHNGISQTEICQILGRDKAAVARSVVSLVKRGYLTKADNPTDRRASLIYPTAKSEELKVSKRHIETVCYEYLLDALSDEEKKIFVSLLEKVYERSKEESKSDFKDVVKLLEEGEIHE